MTDTVPLWAWFALGAGILVMLSIDLLSHRKAHVIEFKEAAKWSIVWITIAIIFGGIVFATLGTTAGVEYTTAWLLEKSLSVDNLFVFALIFGYFKVPREYQHRVLFYGVVGALVMRGIFLTLGVAVVNQFTAILFVFAAVLIWSAIKLAKDDDESAYDPGTSKALKLLRKVIPVRDEYAGMKFFVKEGGKRVATPLLAVLVAIETADLVFAVDSVPAVLAVSDNAFIVFSSNAFAILGLRALYFLLSGLLAKFHYLSKGLAIILGFIGVKLALQAGHEVINEAIPHIPSWVSLVVVSTVLAGSVILSILRPQAEEDEETDPAALTLEQAEGGANPSSTTAVPGPTSSDVPDPKAPERR